MPPASVPATAAVAAKWARRAGGAGEEYRLGVTGAGGRWAAAAKAAENNYRAAVTAAAGAGRFGKGIDRAGAGKYEKGAVEKGTVRFGPGVSVAEQDYSSQVAPYLEAIGRTDLPARQPTGSEANIQRVSAIARALRQLKERR